MSDFQIIGGVALIIFGARFLRKGLMRIFGDRMMQWFAEAAEAPHRAIFGGAVAGMMIPSSTGLSLAAMHLTENGKIPVRRIILILLAAHAGTTLTVQLLAFNLQGLAGLFLFLGVVMFQFIRRETLRGIGQCLVAVGFIFFAMQLIGSGARQALQQPEINEVITLLSGHPLIIAGIASVLVVCLQSSTATIGMLLAYAASGVFQPAMMLPWIAGVNVGVSVTTLATGWGSDDGRRIGFGALTVKVLVALGALLLPLASLWLIDSIPGDMSRRVANAHTMFSVVSVLVMVIFGYIVEKWVFFLVPKGAQPVSLQKENLLDENLLDSPQLALARATRQALRMGDETREMYENFWIAYKKRDISLARMIQAEDDTVDRMNIQIADYLSRVCDEKTPEEMKRQLLLLSFCNELESIGDIVEKHLCDLLVKMLQDGTWFAEDDTGYLREAYHIVLRRFETVCGLLSSGNRQAARALVVKREELSKWFHRLQIDHHTRMSLSSTPNPAATAIYLDMLDAIRRINSHLTSIARSFEGDDKMTRKKTKPVADDIAPQLPLDS